MCWGGWLHPGTECCLGYERVTWRKTVYIPLACPSPWRWDSHCLYGRNLYCPGLLVQRSIYDSTKTLLEWRVRKKWMGRPCARFLLASSHHGWWMTILRVLPPSDSSPRRFDSKVQTLDCCLEQGDVVWFAGLLVPWAPHPSSFSGLTKTVVWLPSLFQQAVAKRLAITRREICTHRSKQSRTEPKGRKSRGGNHICQGKQRN